MSETTNETTKTKLPEYTVQCRFDALLPDQEICTNEATHLVAVETYGIDPVDNDQDGEYVAPMGADWALVCEQHMEVAPGQMLPFAENTRAYAWIAALKTVLVDTNIAYAEAFHVNSSPSPTRKAVGGPAAKKDVDPEAPWGRRKDGTPRSKPGRKVATSAREE